MRPLAAFLLVLVHFAAYMTVYVLAAGMAGGATDDPEVLIGPWNFLAAMIIGPLMGLYVGLNRYAAEEPLAPALRLGRPTRRQVAAIVLAVLAGAALAPVGLIVKEATLSLYPWSAAELSRLAEHARRIEPGMQIALLIGQVLLLPVAVELFFRGFLQPRLAAQIGGGRAFAVTLALLVGAQINPLLMPEALVVGALVGLIAWRSRSTWIPIAAHVAYQLGQTLVGGYG